MDTINIIMNTYSKILVTILPLMFLLLAATVGTTYYFSRSALTEMAGAWLDTRLSEAMEAAASQDDMLHQYGLEKNPTSIAMAKQNAGNVMATIAVGKTGFIFAVETHGVIVIHPTAAMIGRNVSHEAWFARLKPGKKLLVYKTPEGKNLAIVDYFKPWDWYIIASDSESEVYGVANRMKPYLIGLGILSFTAIGAAVMLLTRRLTEPLRLLTAGAERIGKGELDTHIAIRSRDEFGRLARVFNQMTHQLEKSLTTLQNREAHFRSLIEHSSDLIVILDANGCMTYLSPSVERILG
jgi:methyl-accepting chemotaxis protein